MGRVLLIDDSIIVHQLLAAGLERGEHEVVGAAVTTREGLALFQEHRPDLTILDLSMPDMHGLETLARIRDVDPYARVVICSAHSREHNVLAALKAGAVAFLVKPVTVDHLLATVAEALAADPRDSPRPLSRAETQELLGSTVAAELATTDPAGFPRVTPHAFLWKGGCFVIACGSACRHRDDLTLRAEASLRIAVSEDPAGGTQPRVRHLFARGEARIDQTEGAYWAERIAQKYGSPGASRCPGFRELYVIELVPAEILAESVPLLPAQAA